MQNKSTSLYSLSKYTNYEIVMESQFASAGAHQAKLLEKFEKNKNYIKNQAIALKVIAGFLNIFVPLLFILIFPDYLNISEFSLYPPEGLIIIIGSFISMFYTLSLVFTFLFGLFTTSSLMTGTAFKWIQTLPLSKSKVRKLGFMTLFRNLNISTIIMILAFPITLLILTQNIFTFIVSLISSLLITMFCITLLIIIGEKFSHLFSERVKNTRKSTLLRIISLFSYFILAFSSGILITIGLSLVDNLINLFSISRPPEELVLILSLIPFPLAPSFLVGLTIIPGQVPLIIWLTSIIGIGIFAFITFIMYKVAVNSLGNITRTEEDYSKEKERIKTPLKQIEFEVKPTSPVRAYIRKDLVASLRDYQSLIFILMPIIYPLIMVFSMGGLISENISSPFSIMILWSIIIIANVFIPILLVGGLLSIEESGSSILSSLPLIPRDQAKAKIILMLTIHSLSMILLSVVLTILTQSVIVLVLMLGSLPIVWTFLLLMFEMKIYLFSKMKYRYVLEEVNKKNKLIKWISMIAAEIGFFFLIFTVTQILFTIYGLFYAILGILIMGLISLPTTLFALYRMFPKAVQLPFYETGGFLRKKSIIGTIVLLILFIGFPMLGSFLEGLLIIPWIVNLPYLIRLIIDFLWIQAFFALLLLFIVPNALKLLGTAKSFKDYAKEIGILKVRPIGKIFVVALVMFLIFALIKALGAYLLGNLTFAPELLFGAPNPSIPGFLGYGWFIWIFMLQPGIWEETTFRGVMIPMLTKRYSNITAIIISSILFGSAHAINVIYVSFIGGELINVLFQIIYAFFLGLLTGYIFIKTKSLIPTILFHYLIDTIGLVILLTQVVSVIVLALYTIVFVGILPAFIGIIFIRLISKKWNNKSLNLKDELIEKYI